MNKKFKALVTFFCLLAIVSVILKNDKNLIKEIDVLSSLSKPVNFKNTNNSYNINGRLIKPLSIKELESEQLGEIKVEQLAFSSLDKIQKSLFEENSRKLSKKEVEQKLHHMTGTLNDSVDALRDVLNNKEISLANKINFFSKCSLRPQMLLSIRAMCLNFAFELSLNTNKVLDVERFPSEVIKLASKI